MRIALRWILCTCFCLFDSLKIPLSPSATVRAKNKAGQKALSAGISSARSSLDDLRVACDGCAERIDVVEGEIEGFKEGGRGGGLLGMTLTAL